MNGLVSDCVLLCSWIFDALLPTENWAIINIAKTTNRTFTYPSFKEIPTSYGYTYDRVPNELIHQGVIEAVVKDRWFINLGNVSHGSWDSNGKDLITTMAKSKGYINDLVAHYYSKWDKEISWGPKEAGQFAILINIQKLIEYTRWYNNVTPKFIPLTGELYFLGQNLKFDGEIKRKTVDLLVKNINSIVPKSEFYELREDANATTYEQQKTRKRLTKVSDRLEGTYKEILEEIEKHPILGTALVPVQKKGFGLFVNNSMLVKPTTPQNTINDSPKSS